LLPKL
jgi:hypothetical protein